MKHTTIMRHYRLAVAIILLAALGTAAVIAPVAAQSGTTPTPAAPIRFTGVIQSIDTGSIVVNGLPVNLTATGIAASSLQLGAVVTIAGTLENGVVLASELVLGSATAVPTPTSTPRSRTGGDDRASDRSNDDRTSNRNNNNNNARPRIVIEGPVRQINITSIQIFDLTIQVAPDDPTLSRLRVGDVVRVDGDFSVTNNTVIIVAINITVININTPGRDSRTSESRGRDYQGTGSRDSNRDSDRTAPPPPPSRDSRSARSSRSS